MQEVNIKQTLLTAIAGVGGGTSGSSQTQQQIAQSFVAKAASVDFLTIGVSKSGTPTDNLIVSIYDTLGGTQLQSESLDASTFSTFPVLDEETIAFASPEALTIGATYYIVFSRSGARDASNYPGVVVVTTGNPYADGGMYSRANLVWSNTGIESYDLWFYMGRNIGFKTYESGEFTDGLPYNSESGNFISNDTFVRKDGLWQHIYFDVLHDQDGEFLLDQNGGFLRAA